MYTHSDSQTFPHTASGSLTLSHPRPCPAPTLLPSKGIFQLGCGYPAAGEELVSIVRASPLTLVLIPLSLSTSLNIPPAHTPSSKCQSYFKPLPQSTSGVSAAVSGRSGEAVQERGDSSWVLELPLQPVTAPSWFYTRSISLSTNTASFPPCSDFRQVGNSLQVHILGEGKGAFLLTSPFLPPPALQRSDSLSSPSGAPFTWLMPGTLEAACAQGPHPVLRAGRGSKLQRPLSVCGPFSHFSGLSCFLLRAT